jgi:hypothetical protein
MFDRRLSRFGSGPILQSAASFSAELAILSRAFNDSSRNRIADSLLVVGLAKLSPLRIGLNRRSRTYLTVE